MKSGSGDIRKAIGKAGLMQIATAANAGGLFLLSIVFARMLSVADAGRYAFVMSVVGIVSVTSLPGLQSALIRAIAKGNEGNYRKSVDTSFRWSVWGSCALWIGAVACIAKGEWIIGEGLTIAGMALPLYGIAPFYYSYYAAKGKIGTAARLWLSASLTTSASVALVVYATQSVTAAIAVFFAAQIATSGAATLALYMKTRGTEDPASITLGKRTTAAEAISTVASFMDTALVGAYLGFEDLAIYAFAKLIPEQTKDIGKSVAFILMPEMAREEEGDFRRSFMWKFAWLVCILGIIAIAYIACAPFIFGIFFPAYAAAIPYSRIFALGIVPFANHLSYQALQARGKTKAIVQVNAASSAMTIACLLALLPPLGLTGAVIARVISRFFSLIFTTVVLMASIREKRAE